MASSRSNAVGRATLGNMRLYYDADEALVRFEYICRLCGRWREECQCDPQAKTDATLAAIRKNLEKIRDRGK